MAKMNEITSDYEVTTPLKTSDSRTAIPDHRSNYRRKNPTSPNERTYSRPDCCKNCMAFLLIIFIISTLTLVAFTLWREFLYHRCAQPPIYDRFPGYFRTAEQHTEFARLSSNLSAKRVDNSTVSQTRALCRTVCSDIDVNNNASRTNSSLDLPTRTKYTTTIADATLTSSPCCISTMAYSTPSFLVNVVGKSREVVQLDTHSQYLRNYTCRKNVACKHCECVQEMTLSPAVCLELHTPDQQNTYSVDYFPLPAFCHCISSPLV